MAKFLISSYWLGTKKSFSDVDIVKDYVGYTDINSHGLYGDDYILFTKKTSGYPPYFDMPVYSIFCARNWHYPGYEDGTRRYIVYYGSYVKRTFLENIGNMTVLLSCIQRGEESFVFEQPVRNNDAVFIKYNFINKTAEEYDYNNNKLTSYNIFINKDFITVTGGWADKDRWLSDLFYMWNCVVWNKFNPLIETPFFTLRYMPIASAITFKNNASAKIIIGDSELQFLYPKFLIVRPSDNKIFKIQPDGIFLDISGIVDLDNFSSFYANANNFDDYGLVSDETWNDLMGTDNKYLWFVNNDTVPKFILRFSSLNISDGEFIYVRRDYNKFVVLKDSI